MTKPKPYTPFRSLFFKLSSTAGFDFLSESKPSFLQKHRGPEQVVGSRSVLARCCQPKAFLTFPQPALLSGTSYREGILF